MIDHCCSTHPHHLGSRQWLGQNILAPEFDRPRRIAPDLLFSNAAGRFGLIASILSKYVSAHVKFFKSSKTIPFVPGCNTLVYVIHFYAIALNDMYRLSALIYTCFGFGGILSPHVKGFG